MINMQASIQIRLNIRVSEIGTPTAYVEELPALKGVGDTPQDAINNLKDEFARLFNIDLSLISIEAREAIGD